MKFRVHRHAVVGSTNDEARLLLQQGAGEGAVVLAQQQTAGRGRQGRNWVSEPGNLYCSLVLRPCCSLNQVGQLSYAAALGAGSTILPFLERPEILSYKWPNDILLGHHKVAGILIETVSAVSETVEGCIAGIGVNLDSAPAQDVTGQGYPATTLSDHSGFRVTAERFFTALLDNIYHYYKMWLQEGFEPLRSEWLKRAHGLGQEIAVRRGNSYTKGQFTGLSPTGALVLKEIEGEMGTVHHFASAEILDRSSIQEN